ncbi:MAG: hypothetical protein FJ317_03505 [SAR202 cluster bacterium]|nr:hypothetical protein [SAR202 cluster bacterium]
MDKPAPPSIALFVAAHAFAWLGFLFLLFFPFAYTGVEVAASVSADGTLAPENETVNLSIVQANGYRIIAQLIVPVVISGVALFSVYGERKWKAKVGITVWAATIVLILFAGLGVFTLIGISYAPAALVLFAAAFLRTRRLANAAPRPRRESWD